MGTKPAVTLAQLFDAVDVAVAQLDALDDAADAPVSPPRYVWVREFALSQSMLLGRFGGAADGAYNVVYKEDVDAAELEARQAVREVVLLQPTASNAAPLPPTVVVPDGGDGPQGQRIVHVEVGIS